MATFPQWEYDLLSALGAPASSDNLTALNLWAQSEGSVTNNPLATSGQGAGATKCVAQCGSTSPIYEYATEADGVAQMAGFLKGSYYTAIVRAFTSNAGLAAIYQAINQSPWCRGCQGGQYPVDLSKAVGGGSESISPTVGGGSVGAGGGSSSSGASGLSQCVFQAPGFLFFSGPCFLTKGGVKWLSGAACIVAGGVLGAFGVVLVASALGQSTGASDVIKKGARTAGIGGALLLGQPEAAGGIAAATGGKGGVSGALIGAQARRQKATAASSAAAEKAAAARKEAARREGVTQARRRLEARRRLAARAADRNPGRAGTHEPRTRRQADREGREATNRSGRGRDVRLGTGTAMRPRRSPSSGGGAPF